MRQYNCAHCGAESETETSAFNRARRKGATLYCGRDCAGEARSFNRSEAEKKRLKRAYDMEYREKNRATLEAKKAAYFQETYDPKKARVTRRKRAVEHAEYCRRPEYKAWKREYDKEHRAKKDYGEFWESHILLQDITTEALSQASRYEIMYEKGTYAKTQQRRREYDKANGGKSQGSSLGHAPETPIGRLTGLRR